MNPMPHIVTLAETADLPAFVAEMERESIPVTNTFDIFNIAVVTATDAQVARLRDREDVLSVEVETTLHALSSASSKGD